MVVKRDYNTPVTNLCATFLIRGDCSYTKDLVQLVVSKGCGKKLYTGRNQIYMRLRDLKMPVIKCIH